MAKYHLSENGPRICVASVKACKYGDAPHYGSQQAAMMAYEKSLGEEIMSGVGEFSNKVLAKRMNKMHAKVHRQDRFSLKQIGYRTVDSVISPLVNKIRTRVLGDTIASKHRAELSTLHRARKSLDRYRYYVETAHLAAAINRGYTTASVLRSPAPKAHEPKHAALRQASRLDKIKREMEMTRKFGKPRSVRTLGPGDVIKGKRVRAVKQHTPDTVLVVFDTAKSTAFPDERVMRLEDNVRYKTPRESRNLWGGFKKKVSDSPIKTRVLDATSHFKAGFQVLTGVNSMKHARNTASAPSSEFKFHKISSEGVKKAIYAGTSAKVRTTLSHRSP